MTTQEALYTVIDCETGGEVVLADYTAFLDRYARNGIFGSGGPERFVREVLSAEPDEWQSEMLEAYGRRERRISVRSGHGVGKSACVAWIIVHHFVTEFPQKTAITAPTTKQMFAVLWPEVAKWLLKCPSFVQDVFEVKSETIVHKGNPKESFVTAATARPENPEALAGIHCEDGSVLLVADEASGVHEKIFESASGSMSGHEATTILTGNPVRTEGLFYDTHMRLGDLWHTIHVNCETSKRVAPDFIEDMRRRYGADSNGYRVRVLGEFPKSDLDTIIPIELIEAAQMRDVKVNPHAGVVWGLDPARFGEDRSALVKRRANGLLEKPKVWKDKDTMQLAALVYEEYRATPVMDRPVEILVDVIGLGAGVTDRLRQLQLPVRGINVSESAAMSDQYANLKAELWYKAKEWFQRLDCWIPEDSRDIESMDGHLGAELARPRYKFTKGGKIQVESKDDIKKRGFPSPDLADAFVLTFASVAAQLLHGGGTASYAWNQPLKRGIKGIT